MYYRKGVVSTVGNAGKLRGYMMRQNNSSWACWERRRSFRDKKTCFGHRDECFWFPQTIIWKANWRQTSPHQVAFGRPSRDRGEGSETWRGKWQQTGVGAGKRALLLEGRLPFGLVRTGK